MRLAILMSSVADGNIDVTLDCEYELDNIEVDIEGETYIVEIIKD